MEMRSQTRPGAVPSRVPGLSCVVQAGGASRRMGFDKATAPFLDSTLIERVLDRLSGAGAELVVTSGSPGGLSFLEGRLFGGLTVRVASDIAGPAGAMRGIASSLAAARLPLVCIAACDMPFISPDLIRLMAGRLERDGLDACVPRTGPGLEPLCAVYRREVCLPVAERLLATGAQRVRFLLDSVRTGYVEEPEVIACCGSLSCFDNVNTPADLERARAACAGLDEAAEAAAGAACVPALRQDRHHHHLDFVHVDEEERAMSDESCDCGRCGGGCRGERDEEAAAAYRAAHAADAVPTTVAADDEGAERKIVVSFSSTFDVMEAERLCRDAGVPGRIRPLPAGVTADCGLAWVMPFSGEALAAFRSAVEGHVVPEDYRQLVLSA